MSGKFVPTTGRPRSMTDTVMPAPMMAQRTKHFDVLIVGAGISGIGGAYHLTKQCPGTSFVVLETQESFGGTWWTHRYPGIRSDSDLYTFGYRFKPWTGAPIATAAEILRYMGEVIDENDLARHIRYRHQIASARVVERGQSVDDRGGPHRHRRACPVHRQLSLDVPGLLPPLARATRRSGAGWRPSRADRPSAEMAGGSGLHGQEGGRDRLGRHGGDIDPGDRGRTARTSPCCSARRPTSSPAATPSRSPRVAPAAGRRDMDPRDRAAQDPASSKTLSPAARSPSPRRSRRSCWPAVRAYLGPDYDDRERISRRATGHGGSASPSCPTAIFLRRSTRARRRSSPTRSSGFTETGILLKSGKHAGGRHHRYGDRVQPQRARRYRLRDRRQAADLRRHGHLSRHDVHRRAEHGLGVRLFPGELDVARRPRRRFRVPAPQAHEGTGRGEVRWRCGRKTGTCRCCRGSIRRTSIRAT